MMHSIIRGGLEAERKRERAGRTNETDDGSGRPAYIIFIYSSREEERREEIFKIKKNPSN